MSAGEAARSFLALSRMELRRLVRTRWVVPSLVLPPVVLAPLAGILTAAFLSSSGGIAAVAIPLGADPAFPLGEVLRKHEISVVTVADPAAALAEGSVDAAVLGVRRDGAGRWTARVAGGDDHGLDALLEETAMAALSADVLALGQDAAVTALPTVTGGGDGAPDLSERYAAIPRGWIAATLAFTPFGMLFYVLPPLAAADRASGLNEALAVTPVPPWKAILARLLVAVLVAAAGSALYLGVMLTLVHRALPGVVPGAGDVVRVLLAQAGMAAAYLWAGERAKTPSEALQWAGAVLYAQMALLGGALVGGIPWLPIGGIFVAEGVADGLSAAASTVGITALFLFLAARSRGGFGGGDGNPSLLERLREAWSAGPAGSRGTTPTAPPTAGA